MTLQERANNLLEQAVALIDHFDIPSHDTFKLAEAVNAYKLLMAFPGYVEPTELHNALDKVDAEIEDLCIARRITDEYLESFCLNMRARLSD